MVFSSIEFLFYYLTIVLGIYFALPKKYRNAALFFLNLIFYGWGEPVYIVIMLLSTAIDYTHGIMVDKHLRNGDRKKAKRYLVMSVVLNLSLLIFFKYYDFIVTNIAYLIPAFPLKPLGIPLPIGISFYTFQTMSYTIDVYRGDGDVQKNLFAFGTFVTLFPQLIAGPIVKYKDVDDQLRERHESFEMFAKGVGTFTAGLCKKVLLANSIGPLYDALKSTQNPSVLGAYLGAAAFLLQLYFDFSGYSDMAIGLGRMLGFEFKINFNYPFISKSITEFWRRWHISLGSWFREYVYIPLGGNRCSKLRNYLNILAVWALTGIWHGAAWNFLLWGLAFAALLMIEKGVLLKLFKKLPSFVGHIYTVFFVVIIFVFFSHDSAGEAMNYYRNMFFPPSGVHLINSDLLYYLRNYGVLLAAAVVGSTPLMRNLYYKIPEKKRGGVTLVLCLLGLVISTAYLVDSSYNPFLYFRF